MLRYCFLVVLVILFFLTRCSSDYSDPQKIIDKSIEVHGGKIFLQCTIEFDFRDRHYVTTRDHGLYHYERILQTSENTTHDHLTNDGFYREINQERVVVPDSMVERYSRSVNSVIYFALLPFGLNDPAVKKKLMGETEMDGEPYYKIEITFHEEGGGEDFSDVFLYWIHKRKFTMDYFAYTYETDGGGIRFRKAIKQHAEKGIVLQDYLNYEPADTTVRLYEMESLYKANKLKTLSKIELQNVQVMVN